VTVEETFAAVSTRLLKEDAAVEQARIFASVGLKTGGKFFAFARRGELVVKLPEERVQELLGTREGTPFESGRRVMREWVCLKPSTEAACRAYVVEARTFARKNGAEAVDSRPSGSS
jgi:hypothetical protein